MNYDKEKDYIKEMQGGVLLENYSLTDVLWFMKHYCEDMRSHTTQKET